jgi:sarcosine oxidase gamma subunit
VLEITRTLVGAVTASAAAGALDGLVVPGRAFVCRTADDELMLLSVPQVTDEVLREVSTRLAVLDPDALAIDATDGWAAVTIAGAGARASFGLLSRLELPPDGFTQGEVAHIPAKVIAEGERVLILAPSMWEAHLRDRVTKALGVAGQLETRPWTVPTR